MRTVIIKRGVNFKIGWRWLINSTPKNLTNYSVLIQIKPHGESSSVIASFDQTSPYVTISALDGRVRLELPPEVTMAYTFRKAVIDCWIESADLSQGLRSPKYQLTLDWGVARP